MRGLTLRTFHSQQQPPQELLTRFKNNTQRALEFYNSREALRECLQEIQPHMSWHSYEEMEVEENHHLKEYPHILVSLSHSKDWAIAVATERLEYRSLGIDIELKGRSVNPKTKKYFMNAWDDDRLSENLLKAWTLKEAAFKALSPLTDRFRFIEGSKQLVLKDLWVKQGFFGLIDHKDPIGEVRHQLFNDELLISLAWIN